MRLRDLYPTLTTEEKERLAASVGVRAGYLWQIATGWRDKDGRTKRASLDLVAKLAASDARLHVHDMVTEFATADAPLAPEAATTSTTEGV